MPLYRFTIEGESITDAIELIDLKDAKCQALRYATQAICDEHADRFWAEGGWGMTVADADGLTLLHLVMVGAEALAIQPLTPPGQRFPRD